MFVFLLVIGVTAITLQLTVHKVWERTLREQRYKQKQNNRGELRAPHPFRDGGAIVVFGVRELRPHR